MLNPHDASMPGSMPGSTPSDAAHSAGSRSGRRTRSPDSTGPRGLLSGLVHGARRSLSTLVNMADSRLELLQAELQHSARQGLSIVLWTTALSVAGMITLMLVVVIILLAVGEAARLSAALVLLLVFTLLTAYVVSRVAKLARQFTIMAGLCQVLRGDRAQLHARLSAAGHEPPNLP